MTQTTKNILIFALALATLIFAHVISVSAQQTVLNPILGGTGISSTTAGNVGKALIVSSTNPLKWTLGTAGGGSGTTTFQANGGPFFSSSTVNFQAGSNVSITTSTDGTYTITATAGTGIAGSGTSTQLAVFNTPSTLTSFPALAYDNATGGLTVNATTSHTGNFNTIGITSSSELRSPSSTTGATRATTLNASGAVNASSTLTVEGVTNLRAILNGISEILTTFLNADILNATTSITSAGTLRSVGAVTASSTLTVEGAALLRSTLTQLGGLVSVASTTINGRATTTNLTVTSITNALTVTDANGVFGAYAGSACGSTDQVISISATGTVTCSSQGSGGGGGNFATGTPNGVTFFYAANNGTSSQEFVWTTSTLTLSVLGTASSSQLRSPSSTLGNSYLTNATVTTNLAATYLTASRCIGTDANKNFTSAAADCNTPSTTIAVGANPSASVGLSAVNGTANTFTRSDGAPALSQSIAPTWTGAHIHAATTTFQSSTLITSSLSIGTSTASTTTLWVTNAAGTAQAIIDTSSASPQNFFVVGTSSSVPVARVASTGISYVVAGAPTTVNALAAVGGTTAWSTTSTGNGAAAQTVLFTYTFPTSTLRRAGDSFTYETGGTFAGTIATDKRVKIIITPSGAASSTVFDTGNLAITSASNWYLTGRCTLVPNVTSTICSTALNTSFASIGAYAGNASAAVTSTAPIVIDITGGGTNASDVVANVFRVKYEPAP